MRPDSLTAELFAVAVAVIAAGVLGATWGAARGRWRILARAVTVGACLVTAAAAGLIWVNRQVDAYPTWSSLAGSTTGAVPAVPPAPAGETGAGRVVTLTVHGKASGLTMPMYVYLPARYDAEPGTRFPVIEALHGYPSSPLQWFDKLHVSAVLDSEIAAGRMAPTVVVFPYTSPETMLDTECANLVHGAQAETFLTVDVPATTRSRLRVRADAGGWALIGYSAGGYCATDLVLRHPGRYSAAASLSGYAEPGIPIGDGTEKTLYDDLWRLGHLPAPAVGLYLACARTDLASMRDTVALARAAHSPLSVTTSYVSGGGHNSRTWQAMEVPALDWLSASLGRPTAGRTQPSPATAALAVAPPT
ncbi:alpha/beta hydrolase [Actinoplanes sp. NPDC049681]|uniref:alpha/beta hydrolase n=1 Tax=Actinoplanes sp. NPDC049681 TaxID=3363905 RepID=UPI0037BB339C